MASQIRMAQTDYAVLNKLGQLNVQLLLYAPVIALFYASHEETESLLD